MTPELVVGTRGSALALAQTDLVCYALRTARPGTRLRVERITTTGDARADVPLSELERGMFVTEIESALRDHRIDLAVHSAKDMPSTQAQDLAIAAFLPRADARDVLVSRSGATLRELPAGSRVGTSSPRRLCQLRALRPDLVYLDMRGNVDTRLRKLESGQYDAIVLAAAGLVRLRRQAEITEWLDPEAMLPCVGQGAIAVEIRSNDTALRALLDPLDHAPTRVAVSAERAFLAELGAGCRAAVAAHAMLADNELRLDGMIGAVDGANVRGTRIGGGTVGEASAMGELLARELLLGEGAGYLSARASSALHGKRVAVTRPPEGEDSLRALLQARGALVASCPTFRIEPVADTAELDAALQRLEGVHWLVFTSANAVTAVQRRLAALGLTLPDTLRLAAVGPATAHEAARLLRRPAFVPARATAEELARALPVQPRDVVLFPRANIAGPALAAGLAHRGAIVRDVVAYRTLPAEDAGSLARMVREGRLDAIVFTSPSSVRFADGIADALHDASDRSPRVVFMGPSTAQMARTLGISGHEPSAPAVGAIVEALERSLVRPAIHPLPSALHA